MAKQSISLGSSANDGTGTTLRAGGDLINDNFNEIYNLVGDGTDLSLSGLTLATPTLSTPIIAEIDSSSAITLDATTDIVLDAGGGDIFFKDDTALIATFTNSSTDFIIESATSDKDMIFKVNDGGSSTEVMRLDGDVSALLFPTSKEIRFTDANESIKGDGSNLILKSGGTAFTIPASDGSSGQFLRTDGSGALSFATVSTSVAFDDVTAGDAAVNITTSSGNITIDAAANDSDIIFKGTDGGADTVFMTIDGSAGGDLFLNGGLIDLKNDGSAVSQIKFYCESSNAHAQTLIGAPHSETGTNTLTLPSTGGDAKLVSTSSTATLTNKTLTSPVINTGTIGTSLLPASADGATLGSASAEFSDLFLADAGTIQLGNDQDVRLIHNADKGLIIKHSATDDDKPVILTLQTGESDIAANDVLGKIEFQAPDETTGSGDALLVSAAIQARSEGDFSATANATSLDFMTGASEAATTKLTLTSAGHLLPATDDAQDLGSSSFQFRDIYTGDLNLNNTRHRKNEVDGTSGSWTIQEGEDDLYILNRLNGKKYKFKLEEIL